MNYRMSFSWEEVIELERALDLIGNEDASCNVNMDADSVKAKTSAMKKLHRVVKRRDRLVGATSVDVRALFKS